MKMIYSVESFVVVRLLLSAFLIAMFLATSVEAHGSCYRNNDCPGREICCQRECKPRFACSSCHRDSDCSGYRKCCRGKCVYRPTYCDGWKSCMRHSECPGRQICCLGVCMWQHSCRDFCLDNTNCKINRYCKTKPKIKHNACLRIPCNDTMDCISMARGREHFRSYAFSCRNKTCHASFKRHHPKHDNAILEVAKMIIFAIITGFGAYCLVCFVRKCCARFWRDPRHFCGEFWKSIWNAFKKFVFCLCSVFCCLPRIIWKCVFNRGPSNEVTSPELRTQQGYHQENPIDTEQDSITVMFCQPSLYEERFPVSFDADLRTGVPQVGGHHVNHVVPGYRDSEPPPPSYEDIITQGPPPLYEDVVA